MKRESRIQAAVIAFLLLIVGTLFFLYWGNRKEIWFCDEIYTYESANGFEQEWPATYVDQWMSGNDVERFFAADYDTLSLKSISDRLYSDHVPLYFWIFRMVSFYFFHGSGSVWIGLCMNLFFFLVLSGLVYVLFLKFTDSPVLAGIAVFLSCIMNRLVMEQAMMLRMYLMLLVLELLLLVSAMMVLRDAGKGRLTVKSFFLLFAVSLFGLLTHYHFWVFYAVTAAISCSRLLIVAFRKKSGHFFVLPETKCVYAWIGNFISALLATIYLFPYCQWNLNRGKGQTALHSVFVFSSEKVGHILWGYRRQSASVFGEGLPVVVGLVILFGCIAGGAVLLYKKKEFQRLSWMLIAVLVAQGYQLIVCFTLPDVEEERYLWGSFTIMMLCMLWGGILLLREGFSVLVRRRESVRKIGQAVAAAFVVVLSVGEAALFDGGAGVAYLYYPGKDVSVLKEYKDIPWVVYGPTVGVYSYYDWLIPEQICFITSDRTQQDAEALKKLESYDSFILYTYADYYGEAVAFAGQTTDKNFEGEYLFNSTNLSVYLVNKE